MKKLLKYISIFISIFSISACGSPQEEKSTTKSINTQPPASEHTEGEPKKPARSEASKRLGEVVVSKKGSKGRRICVGIVE